MLVFLIMGSKFCELLTMLFTLLSFLVVLGNEHSWAVAAQKVQCIDGEQEALLMFKEGFTSPSSRFSSWIAGEDCCKWSGVGCNNRTDHVITLDLHSSDSSGVLKGQLRNSLLGLPYLSYLDLSLIDFNRMPIPEFIGSLSNLKYLNLSNANFKGIVPDHLGNLSSLQSLDLSGNSFSLKANNLDWLSGLSSLEVLDLGGVDLSNAVNWLHAINLLPSLNELSFFSCQLPNLQQSLSFVNFTSLKVLDLSYNSFHSTIPKCLIESSHTLHYLNLTRCQLQGSIPDAFVNFTSLTVLDFSYNNLQGSIPHYFGNMTSLVVLDLTFNSLEGSIPPTLGLIQEQQRIKHSPLRELYLSYNKLNGSLEKILPQFSELVVLEVASNSLQGFITEVHLQNFSSLRVLDLSGNQLILNMSSNWTPAFQLQTLGLNSCKLGPRFPQWLQKQTKIVNIDLSNSSISDTVPDWFWDLSPAMQILDLSFNRLGGELPDLSSKASLITLHLNENVFSGYLPHFPPNMVSLDVAGNEFFGPISTICDTMNEHNALLILILGENHLSGHLPDCWTYGKSLRYLDLSSNNFSGELPQSLMNCINLSDLVLAENALSGRIPAWLGESLQNLVVLQLDSNVFEGNIPWQLCQLKYIMVLSLSSNLLSGRIPRCINNFQVLAEKEAEPSHGYYLYRRYAKVELKKVMWIDSQRHGLHYRKSLDLSFNSLTEEIPREITELIGLVNLDLSFNHLSGTIPCDIGSLKSLEHLDLSYNNLSGEVPSFNLSANTALVYAGNRNLCGHPLQKNCSINEPFEYAECRSGNIEQGGQSHGIEEEDRHGFDDMPTFYISVAIGFFTGFWGFWAILVLKKSWRHAYFRCVGNMGDKIYVFAVVYLARLRRKFQREKASD
ncbi:receptor-like protein EIX1 [Hevea brasiliensis]|uniref:receptor-like protein EIX1 n=1 Tax=Hevea brasiliensis TaxID=3981 RepID=UPI0025E71489|nr:receptor-like protein EIX1 [Hevea brasiliensis]